METTVTKPDLDEDLLRTMIETSIMGVRQMAAHGKDYETKFTARWVLKSLERAHAYLQERR